MRRRLEAGAHALDLNAGIDGRAAVLLEAARRVRTYAPSTPLFLDTADAEALAQATASAQAPIVANAVVLGDASELATLEAVARADAGAVLSPRMLDEVEALAAEPLADILRRGIERARQAGIRGPLYLDALAYPPTVDRERWERALQVVRALAQEEASVLLALGNVGYGAAGVTRRWLRLITAGLALGAGARALILSVLERPLVEAVRALEDSRAPASELDEWLRALARASAGGASPPPPPPTSAPRDLVDAWGMCVG